VLLEDDLRKMIIGLKNAIQFKITKLFDTYSRELRSLLIPEFHSSVNEVIIVPGGVLGTLPFEALKKDKFLLEEVAIGYDYSATLFTSRKKQVDFQDPKIMLVAPVDFKENETQMSSLPATKEEVKEIRYLFMGTDCVPETKQGRAASESIIKSADLGTYKFLHFATHGIVDEDTPELSRLFLSPDANEDGSLYTGEIYNLKLNAELVTLSACETGLGKVAKGEGIVGLSRALQYAGANNLVVSLWQVADRSTSDMMVAFYKAITTYQQSYAYALRSAKLQLLESEKYNEPYYWAPFILIGN
ncbi:MAG: CHAT domain-containing protein, partial [Bacteroidota bacterium]